MILVSQICKMPETQEFLKSPIILPSKKMEILHNALGENVEPVTMSLIDLLVKNGRESFLPSIARVFIHETLKYKGITRSVLTTAVKVDKEIRDQIIQLISDVFKTKVELEEAVDSVLIGGFILRVDDNYIDASVRTKLNKIKKELSESTISAN